MRIFIVLRRVSTWISGSSEFLFGNHAPESVCPKEETEQSVVEVVLEDVQGGIAFMG